MAVPEYCSDLLSMRVSLPLFSKHISQNKVLKRERERETSLTSLSDRRAKRSFFLFVFSRLMIVDIIAYLLNFYVYLYIKH